MLFDDTRDAWQARSSAHALDRVPPASRTEFMVHYDGGEALSLPTHADCLARVRQDQRYHMDSNGWADIGYNGLVCQHGRAIEGRGIDVAGAHCPNHNTSAYGWQFMVGGAQQPTQAALTRMARAYADCNARSGRLLARKGHRDGFATECPGAFIYSWVRAAMPTPRLQEAGLAADDVKQVNGYTRDLILDGFITGGKPHPSVIDILVENQRRITALAKLMQPAAIAAAVRAALPADAHDVDVDALARKIVVELGKD